MESWGQRTFEVQEIGYPYTQGQANSSWETGESQKPRTGTSVIFTHDLARETGKEEKRERDRVGSGKLQIFVCSSLGRQEVKPLNR